MKKLLGFLILILGIAACSSEENTAADGSVEVKFYNKTGADIDSLVIAKTFIGQIKNEKSTAYLDFKNINELFGQISCISNNEKLSDLPLAQTYLNWCGTVSDIEPQNKYILDLRKSTDSKGNINFFLATHY
ncbi:hypothetical protein [Flavobacterium sp. LC2016-01]|uniref:hypothetical protein n=1 Tax=Flavobacterium sp. LC2016-01 TaxID=2675876 RepID=UPI0012BA7C2F|nr:hypothetical protein [Flavobacterium sp. LC2016-01]MTH15102.1 hypothetical protein [Flavobacterium sp. LC2016-01]